MQWKKDMTQGLQKPQCEKHHSAMKPCAEQPPIHYTCAGEWPLQDSQRLCAFVMESALQRLHDGGETLLGLFDLRGFGPSNADFDFFYFMVCADVHHPSLFIARLQDVGSA